MKVKANKAMSLGTSPNSSGRSSSTAATTTMGIVNPMLASAEPMARFMLVCKRLARAARMAAQVSGMRTIIAITMPTALLGASNWITRRSSAGDISLARPTTVTRDTTSSPKLDQAWARLGGSAWTDSSAAAASGRK